MRSLRTCSTMLKSASLEKSVSVLRRRADFRDSISRISSNLVDDDNDNDDDNDDVNDNAHVQVTCSNKQELWYHEPEPVQVLSK